MLKEIITRDLHERGLRRSDVPELLGYARSRNTAKCLRRFDAVCDGDVSDLDMVQRIVTSVLGTPEVVSILALVRRMQEIDRRERAHASELKARRAFVPHVLVVHERTVPDHPFFIVAVLGVDHFKRIDLPDYILSITDPSARMDAVAGLLAAVQHSDAYARVLDGPFGPARQFLYRDAFDHAWVFDLAAARCIGEHHGVPRVGRLRYDMRR